MPTADHAAVIHQLWPLLFVQDIDRSIQFYRDQLGFALVGQADSGGRMFWCRLARGGASIMLQQANLDDGSAAERRRGVALYFICDDANTMFAELSSRGLRLDPPEVASYGMKQLFVPEPDGYSICFESESGRP